MLKSLTFFLRYYLFWMLFFALDRFVFMFWFHKKLRSFSISEKLLAFYHGLSLDFSIAGYIAVISLLIFLYQFFLAIHLLNKKQLPTLGKMCYLLPKTINRALQNLRILASLIYKQRINTLLNYNITNETY